MKGYRFYEELENKNSKAERSQGNVIAVCADLGIGPSGNYEGLSAVYFEANSPVNWGGIAPDYLRYHCRRVSEARAREIHPRLFERLDD